MIHQEQTDQDMADEVSEGVNSIGEVLRVEYSNGRHETLR